MTGDTGIDGWPGDHEVPGSQSRASWLGGLTDRATLVLDQAFDADSLYQLRVNVAARAADSGLPRQRRDDLVMAVHELAANVVRHGPGHGWIRVWRAGATTVCEISDDGSGQASDGRAGGQRTEDGQAGVSAMGAEIATAWDAEAEFPWPSKPGHGLWLVRQIADRSLVRRDARGVTAVVSFCADPAGLVG